MIKTEILKRYQTLTLFDCGQWVMEEEGRFPLLDKWNRTIRLTLRDTVVHPDGWDNTGLLFDYTDFSHNAALTFSFGKPYANEKADTAKVRLCITRSSLTFSYRDTAATVSAEFEENGRFTIECKGGALCFCGITFPVPAEALAGYLEIAVENGNVVMTGFTAETEKEPYSEEEHEQRRIAWRHHQLDKIDACLDDLEQYLQKKPDVLPKHSGELYVPLHIADIGETVTIRAVSFDGCNAALAVTKNCYAPDAKPEQQELDWIREGDDYTAEIELTLDVAGNTKIEFWTAGEKLVRQIAVLDTGYMAVIPWIGTNIPFVDETIHRFDLPGDYWFTAPPRLASPEKIIECYLPYLRGARRYGDRIAPFVNAGQIIPDAETDTLFALDRASQERGFAQIKRQMQIMGYGDMELIASYTPDATTMDILNKLGVKALTSLCAWQNWHDGGWEINHCGVSNQPYFPADENFRRADAAKDGLMCFTMGNSSCNRNYSVMAYDACPSNVVPGERYLEHQVVNHGIQRFYDVFDGYIQDSKNADSLLTVTVPIESFHGRMDWNAANEAAVRHLVKRAATEKIVFTSAADIADYHKRRQLKLQEAYFFQPDCYYGYGNGTMPSRIDDRMEAVTGDYLAVIRRSSMLPMYFYDYTIPWDSKEKGPERNEFGQIDPDEHLPSECVPKQVFREDMTITSEIKGNRIRITAKSPTAKKKMVTGLFDIPFASDFIAKIDKADARVQKVADRWTGNTHLFIDMGALEAGETVLTVTIDGTARTPVSAEHTKDGFAAMFFGDHAYLRSCDRERALQVSLPAPDSAYIKLVSGKKIAAKGGILAFTVNTAWYDEAPILYGYPKEAFAKAIEEASVSDIGETTCSRWSGQ